jgi:hypothetical protein
MAPNGECPVCYTVGIFLIFLTREIATSTRRGGGGHFPPFLSSLKSQILFACRCMPPPLPSSFLFLKNSVHDFFVQEEPQKKTKTNVQFINNYPSIDPAWQSRKSLKGATDCSCCCTRKNLLSIKRRRKKRKKRPLFIFCEMRRQMS